MLNALRLFGVFFRLGAASEMAYRANFWIQTFESVLTIGTQLGVVGIVASQTDALAGWRPAELSVVVGVYFVVLGLVNVVVAPSLEQFVEDVRDGRLDFTLTKPVDAQLLVSISQVRVWKLVEVLLGAVTIVAALGALATERAPVEVLGFAVALFAGAAIVYSVWISLATLAFWLLRIENILMIFYTLYGAGRWPVGIYPDWLRWALTVIVPVAFAVTVPAEAVTGRLEGTTLTFACALALASLALSRAFWRHGLRHYAGASA